MLARTRGRVPSQVLRRGQLSRRHRLVAFARQNLPTAVRGATNRCTRADIEYPEIRRFDFSVVARYADTITGFLLVGICFISLSIIVIDTFNVE